MLHQVQHKLAGDKLPVLAYAIPAFELFMSNWEKLATKQPCLKLFIGEGLPFTYIHYQKWIGLWPTLYACVGTSLVLADE